MLKERMDLALERKRQIDQKAAVVEPESHIEEPKTGRKRRRTKDASPPPLKRKKVDDTAVPVVTSQADAESNPYANAFQQPKLVSGTQLKDYQLEGVAWMAGLHENGISGILADDMGLGKVSHISSSLHLTDFLKTLQTIAFAAYLRGRMTKPFLVVCPLSVLYNWMSEFKKFAPDVRMLASMMCNF